MSCYLFILYYISLAQKFYSKYVISVEKSVIQSTTISFVTTVPVYEYTSIFKKNTSNGINTTIT